MCVVVGEPSDDRPTETADAPADQTLTIGTAATDTFGGWLPDGVTLEPVRRLEPDSLPA